MPSPRYWREVPARYRLEAGRCVGCGAVVYPARRICPACRGERFETLTLSRRGKVVTSTVIHVAPTEFQMEAPYAMAVIETATSGIEVANATKMVPTNVLLQFICRAISVATPGSTAPAATTKAAETM